MGIELTTRNEKKEIRGSKSVYWADWDLSQRVRRETHIRSKAVKIRCRRGTSAEQEVGKRRKVEKETQELNDFKELPRDVSEHVHASTHIMSIYPLSGVLTCAGWKRASAFIQEAKKGDATSECTDISS